MLIISQGGNTHVLTASRGACAVAAWSWCTQDVSRTLTPALRGSLFVLSPVHTPCKRRRHESVFQRTSPLHAGNRQLSSEAEANQTMQSFLLSSVLWNWVEWIAAVTIAAGTAAIGYLAYKRFYVKDHRNKSMVNLHIQKDNPKIVHAFDMEDLGDKAVYCRCWRSKKFPFCDGSHTKHNEETGDNVGPLIIKKKET
ncbi:CDGSH iron-sulfur domain-containing protein 1 isoform X1 [Prionailurus viverrinus]|uniref:CDGSH iron-sulfur domain-containing protein 1 isoform X2 n=1 Tax=Prionailurus bengalensis TaxID=37029 RepID=UPI001CA90A7E|nr:CDGSH iron-sulfur domain-containing protein 1 isoform X2 [Prionailurus bengalensis]XP_047682012.1 CDGSH iron-sulfur domain-containing protein 1 isoform X1 [Prionailurus viverrinus]